jgi:hypothetical protein
VADSLANLESKLVNDLNNIGKNASVCEPQSLKVADK